MRFMATFTSHFAAAAVCLPGIHTAREWLIFTVRLNHESFFNFPDLSL